MRKMCLMIVFAIFTLSISHAQKAVQPSVSILGDSYSTFEGYVTPSTNESWYFYHRSTKGNDVVNVEDTWWHQLIKDNNWKLCVNNSFSGSTISSSGYRGEDYTSRSFVTRASDLGNPDIIFVFGATNDSWVPSPIGNYKYEDWTEEDLKAVRPSLAKMLDYMTNRYLGAQIYFILNSELKNDINESVLEVCKHYDVPVIQLYDIDKQASHPSKEGMKAIAKQVNAFVKKYTLTRVDKVIEKKVRKGKGLLNLVQ